MNQLILMCGTLALTACASPVKLQNVAATWSCPLVDGVCATTEALDQKLAQASALEPITAPLTKDHAAITVTPKSAALGRTYDQVARIVFAPLVDADGNFHEARVIHAVMQRGSWVRPAELMDEVKSEEAKR